MKKLPKGAHVEGVVPQFCNGPGWSNQLVLVFWNRGGERGVIYLQMEEWSKSPGLVTLFKAGAVMAEELCGHARALLSDG